MLNSKVWWIREKQYTQSISQQINHSIAYSKETVRVQKEGVPKDETMLKMCSLDVGEGWHVTLNFLCQGRKASIIHTIRHLLRGSHAVSECSSCDWLLGK